MDAAALVQLAEARGIDLKYIAGAASNFDGAAQRRRLTPGEIKRRNEMKVSMDIQETVKGRSSRTYRRPMWSIAELGQAARGLGPIPWTAALYSFAGARDGYWLLWNALAAEAQRLARREHWPSTVIAEDGSKQFYREKLAQLVLDEDSHKHLFLAAPQLHGIYMAVTPSVWEQTLSTPYRSLKDSYERWLNMARSTIGRWIREPSKSCPIDNSVLGR